MDATPRTGRNKAPAADRGVVTSLHQRIVNEIEGNILDGRWPPGHRIPSEQALTETYGCSRMTVSKALTQLARAGLILRRRKTGSMVMPQDTQSAILEIYDVGDEVRALNLGYRHEIRDMCVRRATPSEQSSLMLRTRSEVLLVTVMHLAEDEPFCLEERIINLAVVPEARQMAFDELAPGVWLLKHVAWNAAEHRISANAASAKVASALGISRNAPVLTVERQTWRLEDTVTRVRLTYAGNQHAITARFTPLNRLHGRPEHI